MNRSFPIQLMPFLRGTVSRRGAIFGVILLCALLAFEVFNYSTTAFALTDLLGNLKFAGITWATDSRLCLLRHRLCRYCAHLHAPTRT